MLGRRPAVHPRGQPWEKLPRSASDWTFTRTRSQWPTLRRTEVPKWCSSVRSGRGSATSTNQRGKCNPGHPKEGTKRRSPCRSLVIVPTGSLRGRISSALPRPSRPSRSRCETVVGSAARPRPVTPRRSLPCPRGGKRGSSSRVSSPTSCHAIMRLIHLRFAAKQNELPFDLHILQAPPAELPKAEYHIDPAERRLGNVSALPIPLPAAIRP